MFARWETLLSTGFWVANGVRQGGVISPLLFARTTCINIFFYIKPNFNLPRIEQQQRHVKILRPRLDGGTGCSWVALTLG